VSKQAIPVVEQVMAWQIWRQKRTTTPEAAVCERTRGISLQENTTANTGTIYSQQLWRYDGSGTGDRIASGQLENASDTGLHVYSSDGSTFLCEMTSWMPSWKYDVTSKLGSCL